MFLGAIFLIRSPLTPGGVSIGVALAGTVPFAVLTVFLMRLVIKSRKWKSATGMEELIGSEGVVVKLLQSGAEGLVRVHGELWQAESAQPVPEGKTVRILRVDGLKLYLEQHRNQLGGHPVYLIVEDTEAKPETALTKMRKLAENDQVNFVAFKRSIRDYRG